MYAKPFFVVGVRMVIAGLLLYCYHLWSTKQWRCIAKKDIFLFVQIILFHVYFAYILDLWSLQYLTSSQSSFIYNVSPFIAALLSYFCFSEKMTWKKWLGLSIGFVGLLPEMISTSKAHVAAVPVVALLCGVGSAAYGWILMRTLVKERGYSPIIVNGIGMLGGGVLALITSIGFDGWSGTLVSNLWMFVQLITLIIIVANLIFYNFYGYLLKKYTATFLSFAGLTCPLFAALFGWLFLGETVNYTFFVSLIVVSCGLYLFYQEELRQGYISEKM